MLYTTTRNKSDSYTVYRALYDDRSPDGGFYVPFRKVVLDPETVESITNQSFNAAVSQVLELFFPGRITQWDVDCSIGKSAAQISSMPHRVLLAKLWNNPDGDVSYIFDSIYQKLCRENPHSPISDWAKLSIRIAVLFGLYAILKQMGIHQFDIAVNSGDFNAPMAAWYARKMGLPVGTIICACNENSTPWDFIHRGEFNTGASVISTVTKDLDVGTPVGIERLIYESFGVDEVNKYLSVCEKRGIYQIRPDMLQQISKGLFASVIGNDRVESVISSVYRANQCVLDPYTAVSYGSLQDYRSKTGESNPTILMGEKSPLHFTKMIQNATGIADIKKLNQL